MLRNQVNGLRLLFGEEYQKWHYSGDFLPMVTPFYVSQEIAQCAQENFQNSKGIWDMFAGIGGDTVQFAKYFPVIATEIDIVTYSHLYDNIMAFPSDKNIVVPHNVDCVAYMNNDMIGYLDQVDIVYFDPPWGESFQTGTDFDFSQVNLANGVNVVALFKQIIHKFSKLIVKTPITSTTFDKILIDAGLKPQFYTFAKHRLKFIFVGGQV